MPGRTLWRSRDLRVGVATEMLCQTRPEEKRPVRSQPWVRPIARRAAWKPRSRISLAMFIRSRPRSIFRGQRYLTDGDYGATHRVHGWISPLLVNPLPALATDLAASSNAL